MIWETVIGLETHVELATKSKIFCSCSTQFGAEPNTHCCPVCMGMPGTLPMLNKAVLEDAVKAGLALNCSITKHTQFDRKNYFYPDLPKAYQVSQLYSPLCRNGWVHIGDKTIRIHEIHMEEDAGKLIHDSERGLSHADYNRCGVPLIEIVTEPDFRNAEEVLSYLEHLKLTLQYLGVSDCKMQEGSLRCDVNLSVRPAGHGTLGTRTEMKNLGSFKAIAKAIEYESNRQITLIESGGTVIQETRRWDEEQNISISMRTKEDARDYRYFPEPDIPPITLSDEYLERLRNEQPELAHQKRERYINNWNLPEYDAQMLTGDKALAAFIEDCVALGADPKQVSNWILGECLRRLSSDGLEPKDIPISPATLVRLIALVKEGKLNRNTAVRVFDALFADDGDVDTYVAEHDLEQVSDAELVRTVVENVLSANPQSVNDYKSGKEKAFGFLVGQTMRELKGQASPQVVNETLRTLLEQI